MERPDWEQAMKMPIGTLPGGSGNALCVSMLHAAGYGSTSVYHSHSENIIHFHSSLIREPYSDNLLSHATFALVKHDVVPMDLIAVETSSGKRLYSFLSVAWGIVSDVDIESEKYRSMGNTRFTVGVVSRIISELYLRVL